MTNTGYARPEMLVDTDWLAQHLDDPNLRIVDCDPFAEYRRAHIKNAVGISVHHYIKHPDYPSAPRDYPWVAGPDVMKGLMEDMGIGDDTLVITYDAAGSLTATRFWWALSYYGHTNARVLNGGWRKWFDEGHRTSIDRPPEVSATFTPRVNDELICTLDYGLSQVGKPETVFLDVRSDEEWAGTNDRGNRRAGHVPGAVHLEWTNFLSEDRYRTIKPADELRAMLSAVGVTPDKNVVTY
jgi:thiosulfate/3-mercaptopyruvate sulfurtransferase